MITEIFGSVKCPEKTTTAGGIIEFLSLVNSVVDGFGDTFNLFANIRQLGVHADRVGALWRLPMEESGSCTARVNIEKVVDMTNVVYTYGAKNEHSRILR